jgi:CO/xanthine dehydrogenase Mo-binding subunit
VNFPAQRATPDMTHTPFAGRREDRRLITGAGRYTAHVNLPGQAHAAFVRADRAHAEIRGIDTAAARAHPGVLAVYTAADTGVAEFKAPGVLVGYPGRGGMKVIVPPWLPFARERVRYVGEEVAVVLAESAAAAHDAAGLIEVDYEDLPAVAHPEDAIKADAPQVHAGVPGNLVHSQYVSFDQTNAYEVNLGGAFPIVSCPSVDVTAFLPAPAGAPLPDGGYFALAPVVVFNL